MRETFRNADRIVSKTPQKLNRARRDMLVGEDFHETGALDSLASHAAYLAACWMSSGANSG